MLACHIAISSSLPTALPAPCRLPCPPARRALHARHRSAQREKLLAASAGGPAAAADGKYRGKNAYVDYTAGAGAVRSKQCASARAVL